MASDLLRFFRVFFLGSLGLYTLCWVFALLVGFFGSSSSQAFALMLGYGAISVAMLAVGLTLLGGLVALVLKLFGGPAGADNATDAPDKAMYAAIGQALTRYQGKRGLPAQQDTLALSLTDFERALQHKLPPEAYQQGTWWTAASAHSHQWVALGWQVRDTRLTDANPHVVFGPVLPRPAAPAAA